MPQTKSERACWEKGDKKKKSRLGRQGHSLLVILLSRALVIELIITEEPAVLSLFQVNGMALK